MATSTGLRPGFDYDVEYPVEPAGLAEFESEDERGESAIRTADPGVAESQPPASTGLRMPGRRWMLLVPLAAAAIVATVGFSALAMREAVLPALSGAPPPWPSADALVRIPVPEPRNAVVQPRTDSKTPPTVRDPMRSAIDEVLAQFSQSYRSLDAASLRQIWPGADTATLSQEFSGLKYQALSFERCDVRPVRGGQVVASCAVSIAAAPESGDATLQRRQESWSIVFDRSGDRYLIGSVAVR